MDLKLLSLSIKVLEFDFSLFIYLQKLLGHQLWLNTLSTLFTSWSVDKINHVTHEYLVLLLLALVCMLEFTEARLGPNSKAYKAGRAVKAPEYNSSLEGSTEEDALHAESRLMTRAVYRGRPTVCQLIRMATRHSECRWRDIGFGGGQIFATRGAVKSWSTSSKWPTI